MSLTSYWAKRADERLVRFHIFYIAMGPIQRLCEVNPGKGPSPDDFTNKTGCIEYCVYPMSTSAVCPSCYFWWRALLVASPKLWERFVVKTEHGDNERLSKLVQRGEARELMELWFASWPTVPWKTKTL